jgi:6-pyruvoyltetrahydropterin/6-carboxytetrahydropterin synthase
MWTITKEFAFSASHVLDGLPIGHPCSRLHGHNYVVVVLLQSTVLDNRGFVVDYGELGVFGQWIADNLDHQHLNDRMPDDWRSPTAENIARVLFDVARQMFPRTMAAVRVSETPKTWAEYRWMSD